MSEGISPGSSENDGSIPVTMETIQSALAFGLDGLAKQYPLESDFKEFPRYIILTEFKKPQDMAYLTWFINERVIYSFEPPDTENYSRQLDGDDSSFIIDENFYLLDDQLREFLRNERSKKDQELYRSTAPHIPIQIGKFTSEDAKAHAEYFGRRGKKGNMVLPRSFYRKAYPTTKSLNEEQIQQRLGGEEEYYYVSINNKDILWLYEMSSDFDSFAENFCMSIYYAMHEELGGLDHEYRN